MTAPKRYMHMLRSLALVLIAAGLFVQSAAHASAVPQAPMKSEVDCTEMRMATGPSLAHDSDGQRCRDIRLECLVTHGCIPPLALVDDAMAPRDHLLTPFLFTVVTGVPLSGTGHGPETPPPQARA